MQSYLYYVAICAYICVFDSLRNVKNRWITFTLKYLFVLCVGERDTEKWGDKEKELLIKRCEIGQLCRRWLSPSTFFLRQSHSCYFCHCAVHGSFQPILLSVPPRTHVGWKFWDWGCRCESLHTAFLHGSRGSNSNLQEVFPLSVFIHCTSIA